MCVYLFKKTLMPHCLLKKASFIWLWFLKKNSVLYVSYKLSTNSRFNSLAFVKTLEMFFSVVIYNNIGKYSSLFSFSWKKTLMSHCILEKTSFMGFWLILKTLSMSPTFDQIPDHLPLSHDESQFICLLFLKILVRKSLSEERPIHVCPIIDPFKFNSFWAHGRNCLFFNFWSRIKLVSMFLTLEKVSILNLVRKSPWKCCLCVWL